MLLHKPYFDIMIFQLDIYHKCNGNAVPRLAPFAQNPHQHIPSALDDDLFLVRSVGPPPARLDLSKRDHGFLLDV